MPNSLIKRFAALAIGIVALSTSHAALGADYEAWLQSPVAVRDRTPSKKWKVNAAFAGAMAPTFVGGRDAAAYFIPIIDAEWNDRFFFSTIRGVGFNWIHGPDTVAGPRVTYDWGRDATGDAMLRGTEDIPGGAEAGFFLVHYAGPWRINLDLRQRITAGPKALRGTAGLAYGGRIASDTASIIGVNLHYNGAAYNEAYYEQKQAGVTDLSVFLALAHELGQGGYVGFDGQIGRLLGPADKSELTTNRLFFTGITFGKRF